MPEMLPIQYAKNEGVHLAYQVLGGGPSDLLMMSFGVLPIDSMDEEPGLARFQRRLASFRRVIRMDGRGIGVSDPVPPSDPPTLAQWVEDAVAVLDAAGSESAAVFAAAEACAEAILLAASHPERVSSLILVNGTARLVAAPGYRGVPALAVERFLTVNLEPDAVEQGLDDLILNAPSVAEDPAFRSWWERAGKRGASPAAAQSILAMRYRADVRDVLPRITAPTLVLFRQDAPVIRPEQSRYLAAHIPGARCVELPGADQLYWAGDATPLLDEIEEFLTGQRSSFERVLTTVLFTDIVGSTERLAAIGDQRGRDLLDSHDEMLQRQLDRFGGRKVNTTGDGIVARFDSPGRAIECACAMRRASRELGVAIRAGLHTGEVELRGFDISGMTVHLAARIQALAAPDEVLVSRTLADLVAGSGVKLTDRGEHDLKGVPGRWRVYATAD